MREFGKPIGNDALRIEQLLPGPIDRVWSYLTKSEKRSKWLAAGEMELRVGGKVHLSFLHADFTPHQEQPPERFKNMECGHSFEGTVTQCNPPHLLAFTWEGEKSEVKFELTQQNDRVLLVVTHTRLGDQNEMIMVAAGWHTHLGVLEAKLSNQTTQPFGSTFEKIEAEYKHQLLK